MNQIEVMYGGNKWDNEKEIDEMNITNICEAVTNCAPLYGRETWE